MRFRMFTQPFQDSFGPKFPWEKELLPKSQCLASCPADNPCGQATCWHPQIHGGRLLKISNQRLESRTFICTSDLFRKSNWTKPEGRDKLKSFRHLGYADSKHEQQWQSIIRNDICTAFCPFTETRLIKYLSRDLACRRGLVGITWCFHIRESTCSEN